MAVQLQTEWKPQPEAGKLKRGRTIKLNNSMFKIFVAIHALASGEDGQVDLVEFALALALIAIATTGAMSHLGVGFSSVLVKVSSTLFPTD